MMTEHDGNAQASGNGNGEGNGQMPPLSAGKITVQVIGFVIGIALLVVCVYYAVKGGDLSRLKDATAWQLTGLIACTLISVVANASIFWILIRPVHALGFMELQLLNTVVNLLNYAPVRLGLITRLIHHRRVDGMGFFVLFAWYAAFAVIMFMVLGCLLVTTVAWRDIHLGWGATLLALLAVGGGVVVWLSSHHMVTSRLRGADRLLNHPPHVTLAIVLRLVDTAAFVGRLFLAFQVMGLALSAEEAIYLALISMVTALLPAGTLGFRDAAVAFFGTYLLTSAEQIEQCAAAALVDRAAEAVVFIPLGVIGLIWMARQWRRAGSRN